MFLDLLKKVRTTSVNDKPKPSALQNHYEEGQHFSDEASLWTVEVGTWDLGELMEDFDEYITASTWEVH